MADHTFLGTGWSFPPLFSDGGADLQLVSGEEDIEQSLEIILGTRQMERIMQEDFGCELQEFVFEALSQEMVNGIRRTVYDALIYHEPRIAVEKVDVDTSRAGEGILAIHIQYLVRSTNTRYNMVYPFYLNEATDI